MTWAGIVPYVISVAVIGLGTKFGPRILKGDQKQVEATAASIANDSVLKAMSARADGQDKYLAELNARVLAAEERARRAEERADDAEEYIDELVEFLRGAVPPLKVPPRRKRPEPAPKEV